MSWFLYTVSQQPTEGKTLTIDNRKAMDEQKKPTNIQKSFGRRRSVALERRLSKHRALASSSKKISRPPGWLKGPSTTSCAGRNN